MASVEVTTVAPIQAMAPSIVSASKHILRRRQPTVQPMESGDFSYAGRDTIRINLSSATEVMDPSMSYMQMRVVTTGADDRRWDDGGLHGLFRAAEIRTMSGTLIERVEGYGLLAAIESNLTEYPEYVNAHGPSYGDSGSFATVHDGKRLAAWPIDGNALANFPITYTFRPKFKFFEIGKYIPLMLIKSGLQLVFYLQNPDIAFVNESVAEAAPAMTYTISNVEYRPYLLTPDQSLVAQYQALYNGPGWSAVYQGTRYRRQTFSKDSVGILTSSNNVGVRSATAVISVIQGSRISDTVGNLATKGNDSLSVFAKAGLQQYQYRAGSTEYPAEVVDCTSGQPAEVQKQLDVILESMEAKYHGLRYSARQVQPANTIESKTDLDGNVQLIGQATKFIFGARLSRHNTPFTGADLSTVPLDFRGTFGAISNVANQVQGFGNRILHEFVYHDAVVSISSAGLIVRR